MYFMATNAPYASGSTPNGNRVLSATSARVDEYIGDTLSQLYGDIIVLEDWSMIDTSAN